MNPPAQIDNTFRGESEMNGEQVAKTLGDLHLHDAGLESIQHIGDRVELIIELPESAPIAGIVALTIRLAPGHSLNISSFQTPAEILQVEVIAHQPAPTIRLSAVEDLPPHRYMEATLVVDGLQIRWISS